MTDFKTICHRITNLHPNKIYFEYFRYPNKKRDRNIAEASQQLRKCIVFLKKIGAKVEKLKRNPEERTIVILSVDSKKTISNSQKIEIQNQIFSLCIGHIHYCGRKLPYDRDDQIPVQHETDD